jgi:GNAT superfamily N-acetyltransferase
MDVNRSEFFTSKDGEIIFITGYVSEERDKLVKMYEGFSVERRCCGLPPIGRKSIEEWIDELSKKGYMFIAKHRDKVVGHIAIVPEGEKAEFAIFIHQDYEDKGIGTELIRFAEDFLKDKRKDKGIKTLEAITERNNTHAIQLYLKLGFEIIESDYIYLTLRKEV